MSGVRSIPFLIAGAIALSFAGAPPVCAKELKVISQKTVSGFGHTRIRCLRSEGKAFVHRRLRPGSQAGREGRERLHHQAFVRRQGSRQEFFPAEGETLNKPKGIWIRGDRMRFTDIDAVWVVDLKTKKGKKVDLPGAYQTIRPSSRMRCT